MKAPTAQRPVPSLQTLSILLANNCYDSLRSFVSIAASLFERNTQSRPWLWRPCRCCVQHLSSRHQHCPYKTAEQCPHGSSGPEVLWCWFSLSSSSVLPPLAHRVSRNDHVTSSKRLSVRYVCAVLSKLQLQVASRCTILNGSFNNGITY